MKVTSWPVLRQLRHGDVRGLGLSARSPRSEDLRARTDTSERVVPSVCRITQIEGDPESPISRGRLCPKGAATRTMVQAPGREYKVKYRRPHGTGWEELPLDRAMEMIADRVIASRAWGWQDRDEEGHPLRRTLGFAGLGGATLDNEENYLIKKLFTALGAIQIENQARI